MFGQSPIEYYHAQRTWFSKPPNKIDFARYLIGQGADVNSTSDLGKTILVGAITNQNLDMVKLLVENGADVNATYRHWISNELICPLKIARFSPAISEYLISKGAVMAIDDRPDFWGRILKRFQFWSWKETVEQIITWDMERRYSPFKALAYDNGPTDFKLLYALPSRQSDCITIRTEGLCHRRVKTPFSLRYLRHTELMINLPKDWPLTAEALDDPRYNWPMRLLIDLAAHPKKHKSCYNEEIVIPFEPELAAESKFYGSLLWQDPFCLFNINFNFKKLSMLYVRPLYKEEADFYRDVDQPHYAKVKTLNEEEWLELTEVSPFLEAFDKHKVNTYFDVAIPGRINVITGKKPSH